MSETAEPVVEVETARKLLEAPISPQEETATVEKTSTDEATEARPEESPEHLQQQQSRECASQQPEEQEAPEIVEELEPRDAAEQPELQSILEEQRPSEDLRQQESQRSPEQEQPEEMRKEMSATELRRESEKEFDKQEQKEELESESSKEDDEQEKPLEESMDTMQLPTSNVYEKAIEDEEMPSMVTISSCSRMDESDANIKQGEEKNTFAAAGKNSKPSPEKQNDSDSDVCIITDDDDDDNEDEEDEELVSYDDDDDGGDSSSYLDENEEADKERFNEKYDKQHYKPVRKTENDDDEDEDNDTEYDDEELGSYKEEDSEEESDPEGFDGGSDDLVLRHSNGLASQLKERSASLQDIREQSPKKKQSVNPFNQKVRFERNQVENRTPGKYAHVESKVKKYIMDMTEQRRMSCERRKRAQEEARIRNQSSEVYEPQPYIREETVATCKTIKDYTEKALKEVAEEDEDMYVMQHGFENGEISIFPRNVVNNGQPPVNQEEMDVDPIAIEVHRNDEKNDKVNGTVQNDNQNKYSTEKKGIHRREDYPPKQVLNGEDANYITNYRTLSYEEYMKGAADKDEMVDERLIKEVKSIPEKCNNNDTESPCILQIESVSNNYCETIKIDEFQNRKTPPIAMHQLTETFYQENPEVSSLKFQLEQRNAQFDNLRDAYQKTVSENLSMKIELENLKKMLTFYQEQQKSAPEKKVIAVQTENAFSSAGLSMPIIDLDGESERPVDPKLLTNSMMSATSSQWLDSTESAAISMEPPPSITTILNSDESANTQAKTPKQKKVFSRAFITSSKILQTLSNITSGKKVDKRTKPSIPEIIINQNSSTQNETTRPFFSRKRKASDAIEDPQPKKIPNNSKPNNEDIDLTSDTPESQFNKPNDKESLNDNGANVKDDKVVGEVQPADDDVKVFVYPEDEEGKEHSFLIQAKEVGNNVNRGVRECGPYLLGNVEVYMAEVNGTINIWGKELSQGSVSQNIEDLETSTRSKDIKTGFRWQSTPRIFNKNYSASTSKKTKVVPRFTHPQNSRSCEIKNSTECLDCSPHHRRSTHLPYNRNAHEYQSCCTYNRVEEDCCCRRHKSERWTGNFTPGCKFHSDAGKYSLPNVYQETSCCHGNRHNHCRNSDNEESYRHPTCVRRHSFNPTDDEGGSDEDNTIQHTSKIDDSQNKNSSHSCSNSKLVPPCPTRKSNSPESLSCENENDPLISQRQSSEGPEARKRRLSGKRVRGLLLDLLKGNCGDCKPSDAMITSTLRQNTSVYEPSAAVQRAAACSPSQPTCSLRSGEKCSSCRINRDKTAEIEAQLEFFRTEMEKVSSYSNTLRQMLESLRNDDNIN